MGLFENVPEGFAHISFKRYDPENPPEAGHYLVLDEDDHISIDRLYRPENMFTVTGKRSGIWGKASMDNFTIIGYAKIQQVMFDRKTIIEDGCSKS